MRQRVVFNYKHVERFWLHQITCRPLSGSLSLLLDAVKQKDKFKLPELKMCLVLLACPEYYVTVPECHRAASDQMYCRTDDENFGSIMPYC